MRLVNLIIGGALLIAGQQIKAQCTGIDFTFNEDSLVQCGGDTITIFANGQGAVVNAIDNDFDTGGAGTGWAASPAASFTNPCGPAADGSFDPYLWMGDQTAAPRTLETFPLDLSCGAILCFDFKMSEQGDASPCEGPDASNEGIYLEWSSNGGTTWNLINYFEPNTTGSLNAACVGCGDYTAWENYCFTLPTAALTSATAIRWYQGGSSGNLFDHWGLDNIVMTTYPCNSYYYDWNHIPGSPDSSAFTAFVDNQTTYSVIYTNGVDDTCSADVTIYVDTIFDVNTTITEEYCDEDNDGTITVAPLGGYAPYSYSISGPSTANNTTGTFASLEDGTYISITTGSNGCVGVDTVTLAQGFVLTGTTTLSDALCFGDDGNLAYVPDTGQNPFNYLVVESVSGATFIDTTLNVFINQALMSGSYNLTVTDGAGCSFDTSIIINSAPQIIPTFTPSTTSGVYPLPVDFTNTTTGATSYFWDFGDGNSSTDVNPSNTFNDEGDYLVTLTATEGPCSGSASMIISVINESTLELPNVITPNGDGDNDEFTVIAQFIETYQLTIFNRWGRKVFETNDVNTSWDGKTKNGKDVSPGTYFYVAEAVGLDGTQHNKSGHVTVMR